MQLGKVPGIEIGNKETVFQKPDEIGNSISAVINGDILMTVEEFKLSEKIKIDGLDGLIQAALIQSKKDERWNNVRLVIHSGGVPSILDNVFPGAKDIHTAYKGILDTTLITGICYENGIYIYIVPISIDIPKNAGNEIAKLHLR